MQVTKTTIHLKLPDPRRWFDLPTPIAATIVIFCLLAIAGLAGRIQSAPAATTPTPSLLIVLQKEQAPSAVPIAPTPDLALRQELEQLRQRVAELEAEQAAAAPVVAPQVQAPAESAPIYQVVNEAPTPEPPTPIDARTLAIQQHYANEHQQPAQAPAAQPAATQTLPDAIATITTDVQQTGGQPSADWKMDHCIGSGAAEVCH